MDGLPLLLSLAWRNLWRNTRRTAITLVVVSVGLFSVLTMAALMEAWVQSSRDAALNVLIGSAQIHAKGYLDDPTVGRGMAPPSPALVKALGDPAISSWVARVSLPAVVQSEYRALPIEIVGVDPAGETKDLGAAAGRSSKATTSRAPTTPASCWAANSPTRLKTRLGKRVVLMSQSKDGAMAERAFKVVGIYAGNPEVEDAYAFTGRATLQKMLGIGDAISEISMMVPQDDAACRGDRAAAGRRGRRRGGQLARPVAACRGDGHLHGRFHLCLALGRLRLHGDRHHEHPADGGVRAGARVRPVAGAGDAAADDPRPGVAGIGDADRGRRDASALSPPLPRPSRWPAASTSASWPRGRSISAPGACSTRASRSASSSSCP